MDRKQTIGINSKRKTLIVPFVFCLALLMIGSLHFISTAFAATTPPLYFFLSQPHALIDEVQESTNGGKASSEVNPNRKKMMKHQRIELRREKIKPKVVKQQVTKRKAIDRKLIETVRLSEIIKPTPIPVHAAFQSQRELCWLRLHKSKSD